MAIVYSDDIFSRLDDPDCFSIDIAGPVENHLGDTIFMPLSVSLISSLETEFFESEEVIIFTIAATICLATSLIFWLRGANVMHYLPLYVTLIPFLYWVLKIGYASVLATFFHPKAVVITDRFNRKISETTITPKGNGFIDAAINASAKSSRGDD